MRNALRNTKVIVADEIKLPVRYVMAMCEREACEMPSRTWLSRGSILASVCQTSHRPSSTRLSRLRAFCFVHGPPPAAPWNMINKAREDWHEHLCTVCPSLD